MTQFHTDQNHQFAYGAGLSGTGPNRAQYADPQYGAHQYSAPQYGAPEYGAHLYGAPQYGAPQFQHQAAGYRPQPQWQQPPAKRGFLPWLLLGLVALVVAGGVTTVALVAGDDPAPVAEDQPGGPVPADMPAGTPDDSDGDSGGGVEPEDCFINCDPEDADTEDTDTGEANFADSDVIALSFVEAFANGDAATAYSLICSAGMGLFPTPDALAQDFYGTLGFTTIDGGDLVDVAAADSSSDVAEFVLQTDAGDVTFSVVIVEEAGARLVCGYEPN